MTFKCRLEHHYRIPSPVLSILVGKLPKNTTTSPLVTSTPSLVEDVTEQLNSEDNLKLSNQADSWDKEWSWGLDDDKPMSTSPPPPHTTSSSPSLTMTTPPSSTALFDSTSSSPGPPQPICETHADTFDNTMPEQQAPPIVKETYLVSASAAGKYIAMAYQRKFVVVALHPDQEEYIVIGQGSGCSADQADMPKERITSILCLPLFVPSLRKNQIFVMIGYSTGWLRVYSSTGTLLTAQLLESSPIISIKLRTPPPPPPTASTSTSPQGPSKQQKSKQHLQLNNHHYQDDEEITLLFENNRVVSIDGQSLWMVLRVCDGQRESGIDASKMQTAFTYKKWQLDRQEKVRDIISLGPSSLSGASYGRNKGSSWWWWSSSTGSTGSSAGGDPAAAATASALHSIFASSSSCSSSSSTSSSFTGMAVASTLQQQQDQAITEATSRYIGVGTHPMISFYATNETSRPYMSAVSMASYMVSRVATPVFSFAKSWWSGTNNNSNPSSTLHSDDIFSTSTPPASSSPLSSSPSQHTPYVPDMPVPPQVIEQATTIPSLLHLSDPGRTIQSIVCAPPLQHSQHHTLAATSDALGRVILWDIQQGHMIRMWKGVRDAHCGWIQYEERQVDTKQQRHLLLFLVIYSARRGLLKIYQTRHGASLQQKPIGVFHVGPGWHLLACAREPLGSSMVNSERKTSAMLLGEECGVLSTCLLISPHGEVRKITVCPS